MSIHAKRSGAHLFAPSALLFTVFLASLVGVTFSALVAALGFLTGFFGVMFTAVLVSTVTARADVEARSASQAKALPELYLGIEVHVVASGFQVPASPKATLKKRAE